MGRPRGFDEDEVIQAAALLFADRAYDSVSVDDLVSHLGVHRNSLYKTFASKRGLYLAALRHWAHEDLSVLLSRIESAGSWAQALQVATTRGPGEIGFDLLLLATAERAPVDHDVALEVEAAWARLDEALKALPRSDALDGRSPEHQSIWAATVLGARLRARIRT